VDLDTAGFKGPKTIAENLAELKPLRAQKRWCEPFCPFDKNRGPASFRNNLAGPLLFAGKLLRLKTTHHADLTGYFQVANNDWPLAVASLWDCDVDGLDHLVPAGPSC
jgi:hypothetical protein